MRRLLVALGLVGGLLSPAIAADYDLPILRGSSQPPAPVVTVGPATFTRWSGLYFGGVVSYSSATTDFSTATPPLRGLQLARSDGGLRGALLPRRLCSAEAPTSRSGAAVFSVTTRNGRT